MTLLLNFEAGCVCKLLTNWQSVFPEIYLYFSCRSLRKSLENDSLYIIIKQIIYKFMKYFIIFCFLEIFRLVTTEYSVVNTLFKIVLHPLYTPQFYVCYLVTVVIYLFVITYCKLRQLWIKMTYIQNLLPQSWPCLQDLDHESKMGDGCGISRTPGVKDAKEWGNGVPSPVDYNSNLCTGAFTGLVRTPSRNVIRSIVQRSIYT